LNPKNAVAYNSRGNAYDSKGDHDRAISDVGQELIAGIWPRRSGYTRRKVAFRCSGSHPGGPKGNRNAFKHGRYTADRRREVAALIRAIRALAGTTKR
jgi:hypothetical protein